MRIISKFATAGQPDCQGQGGGGGAVGGGWGGGAWGDDVMK